MKRCVTSKSWVLFILLFKDGDRKKLKDKNGNRYNTRDIV